ncbi:MAG: thiamine-phosphate kinase [Aquificae bacterium]|nr:thiamine-phosphate kinase [Aquificota bacterium]
MEVSRVGEDGLVERLARLLGSEEIGDDAAPVSCAGKTLLLSCDALREGTHFLRFFPKRELGWKAVSVSVSDCAASGGRPLWLLTDLSVPPGLELKELLELYEGIKEACDYYACKLVGGNTVRDEKLGLSVFVVGEAERFVSRKGARPGQKLLVSGYLGDARAGLELLLMRKERYEPFERELIRRHLRPYARLDLLPAVVKHASACMDVSDGFAKDALRLARSSSVALFVERDRLPVSDELKAFCKKYGKDPYEYALLGGEDYQLLITADGEPEGFTAVGEVREGEGLFVDGERYEKKGFEHF